MTGTVRQGGFANLKGRETVLSFTCKTLNSTTHDWGSPELIDDNNETGRQIQLTPGLREHEMVEHISDSLIKFRVEISHVNNSTNEIISVAYVTIPESAYEKLTMQNVTITCEDMHLTFALKSKFNTNTGN